MFPTFISILDIQSWWEVPSIAHFCSLFRAAFNLLDFDIEDLEEALLTDGGPEDGSSSWLQELIVRLLSGCQPHNEITPFNYQMFLRRLFRHKCSVAAHNPFDSDEDFQLLPLRAKVHILRALCDYRLDADDVSEALRNLEADSLRVVPLGHDDNRSAYWYFYGTRLYREDFAKKGDKECKRGDKEEESVWQVVCFTEADWFQLTNKFKRSTSKQERQLFATLSENFLPELPRLFKEKERLARKRLLENLPRRSSNRLKNEVKKPDEKPKPLELVVQSDQDLLEEKRRKDNRRRDQAHERRTRLKDEEQPVSDLDDLIEAKSDRSSVGDAMAGKSDSSERKKSASNERKPSKMPSKTTTGQQSTTKPATVGRQTNNSLSAATDQIVIQAQATQPVTHNKKKLKTSQVFRQSEEDLQVGMHKILDHVKGHEDAWPFADPVEEEYAPNYYSIIRKPMDLQKMEERLDAGSYKSFSKFRADFQLIVNNCRLYNGAENEYTEMVDNLLRVFETATAKYLDQITSSDEEIAVEYLAEPTEKAYKRKKDLPEAKKVKKKPPVQDKKGHRSRSRSSSRDSVKSAHVERKKSAKSASSKSGSAKKNHSKDKDKEKNREKDKDRDKDKDKVKDRVKDKVRDKVKDKDKDKVRSGKVRRSRSRSRSLSTDNKVKKRTKNPKKDKKDRSKTTSGKDPKKVKKSKHKKPEKKPKSPARSPSLSPPPSDLSSPPPSWLPSSPESYRDFSPKKSNKRRFSGDFSDDDILHKPHKKQKLESPKSISPKPKDKHNKLRETIEKLKAKSELSSKIKDHEPINNKDKDSKKREDHKTKTSKTSKDTKEHFKDKKHVDLEDTQDSLSETVHKKPKKRPFPNLTNKTLEMEALTLATEQTLKDINKWLDDTPKFSSQFSSASNSPSYMGLDDFPLDNSKAEDKKKPLGTKKDNKDNKKRPFQANRDLSKLFSKRKEVQRTIDRLQPGKSKGNLITNTVAQNKVEELFPGTVKKDTKNSLIVKTDTNAPKLSLGSVLDSFGKHKFVDDCPKVEPTETKEEPQNPEAEKPVVVEKKPEAPVLQDCNTIQEDQTKKEPVKEVKDEVKDNGEDDGGATPNLSAWFKAFGAPKAPQTTKKDLKPDGKENEKCPLPEQSPNNLDTSPAQPLMRQRRISTGSSMSERSSFSQDMDSPRVGMDERLAYPAPYPSPMHKSPSGASPVLSPRPEMSPKQPYPAFNGQMRVGFYQDTVSNKSSPDKSCSPRETQPSPYNFSEHVYTPNTEASNVPAYSSYQNNSPYYQHNAPNYSSSNPTPPYNTESTSNSYYDTSKNFGPVSPKLQNVQSPGFAQQQQQMQQEDNSKLLQQQQQQVQQDASSKVQQQVPVQQQSQIYPVKKRYTTTEAEHLLQQQQQQASLLQQQQQQLESVRNYTHTPPTGATNPYYSSETGPNYALNIPTAPGIRSSAQAQQQVPEMDRKIDLSKFTNMGYSGPDVSVQFPRSLPAHQYNRPPDYTSTATSVSNTRSTSNAQIESSAHTTELLRYANSNMLAQMSSYKGLDAQDVHAQQQAYQSSRLGAGQGQATPQQPDVGVSTKAGYNAPPTLGGNIANLSHIVDRFGDERMLAGLGTAPGGYYADKGLPTSHMFNKPMPGAGATLPMFSQANMQSHQYQSAAAVAAAAASAPLYNRQMAELANSQAVSGQQQQQSQQQQQQMMAASAAETKASSKKPKKPKYRKSASNSSTAAASEQSGASIGTSSIQQQQQQQQQQQMGNLNSSVPQGFQSYAGLKSGDASAISLKTSSVVSGSAFSFGPTGPGLGLYGAPTDSGSFMDDFGRSGASNYYMAAAAAAAHHRQTPEAVGGGDKGQRSAVAAHQPTAGQSAAYPFLAGQVRPPGYPFMPGTQPQLMDTTNPIYQHYLQAGVQGLLGPPGAYPPGYHLSMRQPYDSMTRPSWL